MFIATPPPFLCYDLYDTIDNQAVEQDPILALYLSMFH